MGDTTLIALFLGVLEGLTEFIPVSSTGHLLLAGHFLDFESNGKTFEVVIQFGAVLAILTVYASKLIQVGRDATSEPAARRFIFAVLIAILPAAFVGVLARDFIKNVLFETPMVISISLIIGGIVLVIVDRWKISEKFNDPFEISIRTAFLVGIFQCLALIPGVSRSGATVVGGAELDGEGAEFRRVS